LERLFVILNERLIIKKNMPFITQGKTNIKYLLIVAFVATIAAGIILAAGNY